MRGEKEGTRTQKAGGAGGEDGFMMFTASVLVEAMNFLNQPRIYSKQRLMMAGAQEQMNPQIHDHHHPLSSCGGNFCFRHSRPFCPRHRQRSNRWHECGIKTDSILASDALGKRCGHHHLLLLLNMHPHSELLFD